MTSGYAVKRARLNREMKRRKIAGPTALAEAAGVDKATACRVLNGTSQPGVKFARGLTKAWGLEIPDLFD
ncbi:helix-turn-helix transcriptional regulator [Tsukamurella sp. NPDC003166]|uniref:helix-turn-helix transcriptional regulator n=1 Tax=Tsukamurella sp. NPDC003166 TaxID=3154444 RepID=UPI0033BC8C37